MYLLKYEKYVPYNYSQEGVEYYIPKQDFEEVIQTFLTVESEVLESNAIYNAETKTYLSSHFPDIKWAHYSWMSGKTSTQIFQTSY